MYNLLTKEKIKGNVKKLLLIFTRCAGYLLKGII
jgi:hypothetical protein